MHTQNLPAGIMGIDLTELYAKTKLQNRVIFWKAIKVQYV